ncbi:uroporphyrinogen-III synthase [Moheibacter sediminis]|uniref:Uroporphyrinogen-III synthase n=1 Tax=Moheibacter sediminis TaxID=1434700 RepID=A0A1W1ZSU0_9FLAO|nr:uroporphyrinogen-III synthase [Moheibacter sediminis]SMC51148.1 uroporphyrinogen-III synthase [Moheibacter sediminis]
MKKILFTKEISSDFLKQNLSQEMDFDVVNFLEIKINPEEKIIPFLNKSIENYLLTSQNSVKAIKDLDLKGNFYVVGQKTAEKLIQNNFKVEVVKNYASELAEFILENKTSKEWIFFCGNNRRDELFEKLIPNGHSIKEIQCYESHPNPHDLDDNNYDGIAFFSPLGVKSYLENNKILPETIIFSIGKTTSQEVRIHTKNKIINAKIPTLESVIETINNYYYVEK